MSYLQYAHFIANKVGSTSTDEAQILDQLVEDKPLPITTLVDDYDRFVYFFSQQFVYTLKLLQFDEIFINFSVNELKLKSKKMQPEPWQSMTM